MKQFFKKRLKSIGILSILLTGAVSSQAYDFKEGGLYYSINPDTPNTVSVVRDYTGDYSTEITGDIKIPSTVTYNSSIYTVTSIGISAFDGCQGLTSVEIPSTVTTIQDGAFHECHNLTKVEIPYGVTKIESGAFSLCSALKEITLPPTVTELGETVFSGCTNLESMTSLPNSITTLQNTFLGCSNLSTIKIPKSITSINFAFDDCPKLTEIIIEDVVSWCNIKFGQDSNPLFNEKNLPVHLFLNDREIIDLVIPNGVIHLNYGIFANLENLKSAEIPASVNEIAPRVFENCKNLKTIICNAPNPPTIITSGYGSINYGFDGLPIETIYVLPNAVEEYKKADKWKEYNIEAIPSQGSLQAENFSVQKGSSQSLSVNIKASSTTVSYSGFQFDVEMPEGLSISEVKLSDELTAAGFEVDNSSIEGNPVRVISYKSNGNGVSTTEGIVTLTIKADANATEGEKTIKFTNARLSSASGTSIPLDDSSVTVTVVPTPITSVTVDKEGPISLYVGGTETLTATVNPSNATDPVITWNSSQSEVAKVENGTITALSLGTTQITVTATNGAGSQSKTITVNVIATPAESVTISGEKHDLKVTEEITLTAEVYPAETTYKEMLWISSDDTKASVDSNGKVTAKAVGQVTITATVKETSSVSDTFDINISDLIPGDANDDGDVDVADVVTISNHLTGRSKDNWCFINADANGDGDVNVNDQTKTVEIILGNVGTRASNTNSGLIETSDQIIISEIQGNSYDRSYLISLSNVNDYAALLMDIILPQGVTLVSVEKLTNTNHIINYNVTEENVLKVNLYSLNNSTFNMNDKLFTITLENLSEDCNIALENIYGADPDSNLYSLNPGNNNTTGISHIYGEGDAIYKVFTLQGINVMNTEKTEDLKKLDNGLYIINGKKVMVGK